MRPRDPGAVTRSQLSPRGKVRTVSGVRGGFSVVAWRAGSRVAGTWPVATSWDFGAGPGEASGGPSGSEPAGAQQEEGFCLGSPVCPRPHRAFCVTSALVTVRPRFRSPLACARGGWGLVSPQLPGRGSCELLTVLRTKRKIFADWFVFIRKKMSSVTVRGIGIAFLEMKGSVLSSLPVPVGAWLWPHQSRHHPALAPGGHDEVKGTAVGITLWGLPWRPSG